MPRKRRERIDHAEDVSRVEAGKPLRGYDFPGSYIDEARNDQEPGLFLEDCSGHHRLHTRALRELCCNDGSDRAYGAVPFLSLDFIEAFPADYLHSLQLRQ